ncbi:MAG TPA: RNA polymerase sigma factor [Ktedonobacterales bacterium]|jgi:RNA polymerase sigma-70 factor (ECF subfamily)
MEYRAEPQRDKTYSIKLEDVLRAEREHLVHWCAHLTGNADVAEDLVQETCAVAWRSARRPDRTEELPAWLAGIARNICMSWRRQQQRETPRLARRVTGHAPDDHMADASHRDELPDPFDPTLLLERDELARLLDHALGLLPPATRRALVVRYIEEAPLAEGAMRLGMSESALAARLHRGKAQLRHLLMTQLRAEAASYGLVTPTDDGWCETRIWCPMCAAYRLAGRLAPDADTFALRCPQCFARHPIDFARWHEPRLFNGLSSYRAALTRLAHSAYDFYQQALRDGTARCRRCGGSAVASRQRLDGSNDASPDPVCIRVFCPRCRATTTTTLSGLLLCHTETQRFWRGHPRILALPHRRIEYHGLPAMLTTFVSRDRVARLELISDEQTLETISVIGA